MTAGDGRGSPAEVLGAFLKLGLTSFGGPIAHLGYFREEFVVRRKWIDEAAYADLVALCQFLPGPASSQVGFALGLIRGGWLGGFAAWTGFTLPSALALLAFALGAGAIDNALGAAVLHGLKLVAVAIVAQAVWGMANGLCPDRPRAAIALASLAIVVASGVGVAGVGVACGAAGQIVAIAFGACAGLGFCRGIASPYTGHLPPVPIARATSAVLLAAFVILLAGPPLAAAAGMLAPGLAFFDAFYRSGALVFGGGHVVLPLLQEAVVAPGWVTQEGFLAGYGAAQAVPGPLFTFAAYLGAASVSPFGGFQGAIVALVAIFLPGLLLVAGALPFWDTFRRVPAAQAAMRGTNAAVVGILAAALYDPVWTSAVRGSADFAIVAAGFVLLTVWRAPPLLVVALIVAAATGHALLVG